MKKAIIFILYVAFVTIIFSGCNFPSNTDQFDLRDTVTIQVNEKLYENKDLWVQLDSITRDNRCPEGMRCVIQGGVEAKFTIGFVDTTITMYLSTDSLWAKMAFFAFANVPGGNNFLLYLISARPERQADVEIPQSSYEVDFVLEQGDMVYKPNIYLYPKKKCKLDVSLDFPQGGEVIKSIPDFPCEWKNIKVKPNGMIDNEYEYLFYEAALPDRWQVDEGWSVMINDLEEFFRSNLKEYGFIENEINDFINYWIPKLDDAPYFNIYPQYTDKVDELVTLNISKEPTSIMRMFYVIEESMEDKDLPEPLIPEFERNGFTVTEWGVILK